MTGCNKDHKFIVLDNLGIIELRDKENNFIRSICCKKCLPQLETAIKKLKEKKIN